ncbi:hypothetical protein [Mycolicibacterium neoaurum]|uniref:hypothetical protein n=1 Tax=Mycolicibacterium TaxID=1866885 RepID=UPI001F4D0819|nr:hypothetical protein [Mycolicibacterium neoaurum]
MSAVAIVSDVNTNREIMHALVLGGDVAAQDDRGIDGVQPVRKVSVGEIGAQHAVCAAVVKPLAPEPDRPVDNFTTGTTIPADKVERLAELASTYHFAHVRPSEREIVEARQQAGRDAERAARAEVSGTEVPDEPERPSIFGKANLKAGQLLCENPGCPRYRRRGPVRDIAEWVRLQDNPFVMESLELGGETIRGAREIRGSGRPPQLRAFHAGTHRTRLEARGWLGQVQGRGVRGRRVILRGDGSGG